MADVRLKPQLSALDADTSFDVARVRRDFPILSRRIYGHPLSYLDNAASAQKPKAVIGAMRKAYEADYANVHRGLYFLSTRATQNYEETRKTVSRFINAPSSDEIVFTRNATEAINLVATSFGGLTIGEGDEIVLSILEHHSNIVPWHFYRERLGATLKWAPVNDDGEFLLEEYEKLLGNRVKMVAVTQMSNVTGAITPLGEIIRLAHKLRIPVLVDGSQGAVHLNVDVQAMGCDFYVFTGHKVYGPSGIGVLYARAKHLNRMPPFQGGGEMIEEVTRDRVTYAPPPYRFEAGTPPIVQAVGLGSALNYMTNMGLNTIQAHEKALADYALERLGEIEGLRIFGKARERGAIVAFAVEEIHAHDVAAVLDRYGVAIRAGNHCAMPLLQHFGMTSLCRASFAMYNTHEEVDRLIDGLRAAIRLFA
ncbi:MAG: cysteine desulfurase [Hyphomicrobiales bacterium]